MLLVLRCLFTPPSGRFLHHSRVDLWRPAGPSRHSQITWSFRVFKHSERAIRHIRRTLFLEHKHVILSLRFGWRKSFSLNVSVFITLLLHSYNARTGQMIPSLKLYYESYSDIQDQPLIKYILPVEQLKWYIWYIHAYINSWKGFDSLFSLCLTMMSCLASHQGMSGKEETNTSDRPYRRP